MTVSNVKNIFCTVITIDNAEIGCDFHYSDSKDMKWISVKRSKNNSRTKKKKGV